jgi:hypothetical protein
VAVCQATIGANAGDSGRIRRKPATPDETARRASDDAMTDSILRKGDVIATGHGFLLFRGYAADGSRDFVAVENPLVAARK